MFKHTPLLLLLGLSMPAAANTVPDHSIMQGVEVGADLSIPHDLSNWLISEKYDGVRAYWDGKQLLTRNGYPIAVPTAFTADWPQQHLEGELWIGYGAFEQLSSLLRSHPTPVSAWQQVRFMLFDLPRWPGTFAQRQAQLSTLLGTTTATNLQQIPQYSGSNQAELDALFADVEARGGEGLMLHRASALYQLQRTTDLRKLKPFQDAEAKVIAHLPGKGKYTGMMGSVLVEQADGTRLRIGSGFSDAERVAPPAVGTILTFRYNGLTRHGKPRFARFLRVRPD